VNNQANKFLRTAARHSVPYKDHVVTDCCNMLRIKFDRPQNVRKGASFEDGLSRSDV
jgi:hypothetical protein